MKKRDTDYWIDQYLSGELKEDEKKEFETQLKTDRELQAAYELHLGVEAAMKSSELLAMKGQLEKIHEESTKPDPKPGIISYYLHHKSFRAAAAIIIIFAIGIVAIWMAARSKTPEQLFHEFYEPFDLITEYDSLVWNVKPDLFKEAHTAYMSKNYNKAFQLFENIIDDHNDHYHAYLFGGLAAIELRKFTIATKYLAHIIKSDYAILKDHAEWYLGLTYLKHGKKEEARRLMCDLINRDTEYKLKAEQIVNHL